jgi:peptidoglycan/xylan/chitin deacetylase (PgdA/CDA1 family)
VVPALALTFDDGPDPVWTPRLLDVLSRLRARATFFPIASRALAFPDLIARMVSDGHTVGLHCDEHVRHSERDLGWCRRDTSRALDALRTIGVRPSLWRTPWGDTGAWSERLAGELDLRIVGWTVDTHDWRGDLAQDMFRAVRPRLGEGAVVLAHDGVGPGARRAGAQQTVALAELVGAYAEQAALGMEGLS